MKDFHLTAKKKRSILVRTEKKSVFNSLIYAEY